ncbi:MAG: type II toxin-antitoxin system HicB family antitoxin [Clostridiales Family XIII bacterium]|jgi:predicted RNase H-like HicB family nuclease|nr:type II toxin-antitoxin system HicB family antitoxin [Clostridiales Family XIII bacterium]
MSKKQVYPVVLTPEKDGGYSAYLPDFEKNTQGEDLADVLYMAQDALEMMGVYLQDEGKAVPKPSSIDAIKVKAGEIKTLIPVDFDAYRRKTEKRVIKKTLTLPSWLNVKAENAGINFSSVLQEALKERLGI